MNSDERQPDFTKLISDALHDLGENDCNMRRSRPYTGQPWTDTGIRGATEIRGITFRDLRDAYIRAMCLSSGGGSPKDAALYDEANKGELATLSAADVFTIDADLDPIAVFQNLSCEVEKLMGIWPNVPPLSDNDPTIRAILGEPRE